MKELEMDDFYDAIASPPMNNICYHIASAVYLAKDGDNFSNEQAKWFIKKLIDEMPDSEILKIQEKYDNDE